jgi:hypothetical protein
MLFVWRVLFWNFKVMFVEVGSFSLSLLNHHHWQEPHSSLEDSARYHVVYALLLILQ